MTQLDEKSLDILFNNARSINGWKDTPIEDEKLNKLYELARLGPTAANSNPARFLFIKSPQAKERLKPFLAPNNIEKTMRAPVTIIAAFDPKFYEKVPYLFPHLPEAKSWYENSPDKGHAAGFMNATLGAAYMIMAARAIGLDCGPMSGFDNDGVNKEFFASSGFVANFLINIGYRADSEPTFGRSPRLDFKQACEII
jgi:3-hydroxypropanoate dehydrogenase